MLSQQSLALLDLMHQELIDEFGNENIQTIGPVRLLNIICKTGSETADDIPTCLAIVADLHAHQQEAERYLAGKLGMC